ncbi:hypothetical protein MSG28_015243 [Choristoneura fumiferana]|uniref:Uncharacterized protein n=1 Tax=Choristoneura fumiferana TaxID=7141 RepID=A0ACC0KZV3_CHOFU|nr:hypothetical protein MSG28_015243 [Choristoneura fumiferana]
MSVILHGVQQRLQERGARMVRLGLGGAEAGAAKSVLSGARATMSTGRSAMLVVAVIIAALAPLETPNSQHGVCEWILTLYYLVILQPGHLDILRL